MAFELSHIVPWGRNLSEYRAMFALSDQDLDQRIIGFGDGPASFNAELHATGKLCLSVDPIYQFSREELEHRFLEVKEEVLAQTRANSDNFVWKHIRNIEELAYTRTESMKRFLLDVEKGKASGRYLAHSLPDRLPLADLSFDLGLSSHFLFLYDQLGERFHIQAMDEIMRLCKEVRVFPLLNLNAQASEVLPAVIAHLRADYHVEIISVDYEFQKNGNQMLRIRK